MSLGPLAATRLGDFVKSICKGKPSGPFYTASKSTYVDNRGKVRLGDKAKPGVAISGSKSVFVDNRPSVRKKDKVKCGIIKQSSSTTIVTD